MSEDQNPRQRNAGAKRRRKRSGSHAPKDGSQAKRVKRRPAAEAPGSSQASAEGAKKPRPASAGSTGNVRTDAKGSTGSARRVPADKGSTGSARRVPADKGSTGSARRVPAGSTGPMRRVSGNTGSARRVPAGNGSTGSARRVSTGSTGAMRKVSPGSSGAMPQDTGERVAASDDRRSRTATGAVGFTSVAKGPHSGKRPEPSHAAPRKRGMPVWGVLLIVLVVVGVGVGGFFLMQHLLNPYEGARVEDGQEVTVVIPEGSTGSDIIQILLDSGVIHSSKDFRKVAQDQNADQSFKPGTYTFVTGSDPLSVVTQLVAGPNSTEGLLMVPEGLTITQTARLVESSLGIKQDEFVAQAKAANYVDDYPFVAVGGNDSLEGFLYPKTYDFSGREVSADAVIRLMLDQYETEVHELDLAAAEADLAERYSLNVTDYDILKIASIIEKEALNEDDRAKISSVFYNRLSIGHALESDATMGYATGGEVTSEDLATSSSAYNTYKHKGLPPTPICSPSLWAIQAAMYPADTEYYYFFIIEDSVYSNHTFSKTYEEHDAAYKKALKEQAEANGTVPPAEAQQNADAAEAEKKDE